MVKKVKPPTAQEPPEGATLDLTNLVVVRRALEEAFAAFPPPDGLSHIVPKPGQKHPREKKNRDGSFRVKSWEGHGKFSVATCMTILQSLNVSFFFTDACKLAGVTHKTGCEWVAHGLRKDEPAGSPHWVFAHALQAVSMSAKCRGIQRVQTTLEMHRSSIEAAKVWISWLKMRYPQDFAETSKVDVTSKGQAINGARQLVGINIVIVDAATATPEGHSFIEAPEEEAAGEDPTAFVDSLG